TSRGSRLMERHGWTDAYDGGLDHAPVLPLRKASTSAAPSMRSWVQGPCPWSGSRGGQPLVGYGATPRMRCVTRATADHVQGHNPRRVAASFNPGLQPTGHRVRVPRG